VESGLRMEGSLRGPLCSVQRESPLPLMTSRSLSFFFLCFWTHVHVHICTRSTHMHAQTHTHKHTRLHKHTFFLWREAPPVRMYPNTSPESPLLLRETGDCGLLRSGEQRVVGDWY
jgi:hypothetical protein